MARIAGVNVPDNKHTEIALTAIFGIGRVTAQKICVAAGIKASMKLKDLNDKKLLPNNIGIEASIISKNKKIRTLIDITQKKYAYNPPKKYNGSCLDGRDITYKILPDADFKFFLTADIKTRANRRYKELKKLNKKIKYLDVLQSIKQRDHSDYKRRISPLKKTKDAILIDTTNLTIKKCFIKIRNIIDMGLKEKIR